MGQIDGLQFIEVNAPGLLLGLHSQANNFLSVASSQKPLIPKILYVKT